MFIFLLVAALHFGTPVFAADATEMDEENSLTAGSWALQFRITENFQLSSFQGSTLSAKRHLSDGRAIRVGISLNGAVADVEHRTINVTTDSTTFESKIDENYQFVQLDAQYLIYPSPAKKLTVFVGAGPLFELSRSEASGREQWRLNKIWSFGVSVVLGVEWFATKRISFLSEYSSALTYDIQISESTSSSSDYKNEDERQALSFSYSSVKFGLSVYL